MAIPEFILICVFGFMGLGIYACIGSRDWRTICGVHVLTLSTIKVSLQVRSHCI